MTTYTKHALTDTHMHVNTHDASTHTRKQDGLYIYYIYTTYICISLQTQMKPCMHSNI